MTTFPALNPSSRTFTPGGYPHSVFAGINSKANRVRNSNVMLESHLRLTFVAITESEMLSILTHYQGQRGGYLSFPLPADVWSGVTAADFQLSGYGWIYREPPTVEDLPCGGHNVELILETVPPEGTALLGLNLVVRYSIAGGRAAGSNGLDLTIGYSIQGGRAGLPGLEQTVSYSISGGDATGGALAPGLGLSMVYSISGGRAGLAGLTRTIAYSIAGGRTPSNPIPALSPILWYDFSDASTVTLSDTTITQINGKGSRAWNLTKSTTGPVQATWTNNELKCCDWGATQHSNYLRNTTGTSTSIADVYIVLDAAFGSTFPAYNGLISSTNDSFFVDGNGSGSSGFFASSTQTFDAAYVNGSSSNSYSSGVLPTANSPALLRLARLDGYTITTNGGFQIGSDRYFSNRGWYGLIAEVVCFSSVLSSTDRAAVQNHLAQKWGLTLS